MHTLVSLGVSGAKLRRGLVDIGAALSSRGGPPRDHDSSLIGESIVYVYPAEYKWRHVILYVGTAHTHTPTQQHPRDIAHATFCICLTLSLYRHQPLRQREEKEIYFF